MCCDAPLNGKRLAQKSTCMPIVSCQLLYVLSNTGTSDRNPSTVALNDIIKVVPHWYRCTVFCTIYIYIYIWSAVVLHRGQRYCNNKHSGWNNFSKIFFFYFSGLIYCLLKLLIILMKNIRHPRKKKNQVPFLFIITVYGEIFAPV